MPLDDLHDSDAAVQYIYVGGLHAFGRPKNAPIYSETKGIKFDVSWEKMIYHGALFPFFTGS